jgi:hypothetical protein
MPATANDVISGIGLVDTRDGRVDLLVPGS